MSNVNLRVTSAVTLHVKHLRGKFVPVAGAPLPCLDDKRSYVVAIDSGEIAMDMESLTALMRTSLEEVDANVEKIHTLTPSAVSQNYIYWRGGELRFGKLTMTETDLELIDDDPRDPFDFSIDHWNDQLVAGYSKNTTVHGLKTHVPDYNDLGSRK